MKSYKIKEVDDYFKLEGSAYYGIKIKCSGFELFFGIAEFQQCCEDWGYDYIQVEEDIVKPEDLVGGYLRAIRIGETEFLIEDLLKDREICDNICNEPFSESERKHFSKNKLEEINSGNNAFLRVITDKGDLVARVYNDHNGYYSHNVTVGMSIVKTIEEIDL